MWSKSWFKVVILMFILIIHTVLKTNTTTKSFLLKNHRLPCLKNVDFLIYWVTYLISMAILRVWILIKLLPQVYLHFNYRCRSPMHFMFIIYYPWFSSHFFKYVTLVTLMFLKSDFYPFIIPPLFHLHFFYYLLFFHHPREVSRLPNSLCSFTGQSCLSSTVLLAC